MGTPAAEAAALSEQEDHRSEVGRAAVSYAEHGWPVLPGSTWNGRRYVIPGTFTVTDGPRPLVARNLATADVDTVTRWWSASSRLEPSVLLSSGEAFNLASVGFDLAQEAIAWMEVHAQAGPVLYRPDQGRAYFLVQCWHLLSGHGKPGQVIAVTPGEWVVAPPSRTGNRANVQWWSTPESAGWRPADVAVLTEALTLACRSQVIVTTPHRHNSAINALTNAEIIEEDQPVQAHLVDKQ